MLVCISITESNFMSKMLNYYLMEHNFLKNFKFLIFLQILKSGVSIQFSTKNLVFAFNKLLISNTRSKIN